MGNEVFSELALEAVLNALNKKEAKSNGVMYSIKELYVVWLVKVLGNNKALISSTREDGLYFEATYNGAEKEMYIDEYKKINNTKFKIEQSQKEFVHLSEVKDTFTEWTQQFVKREV